MTTEICRSNLNGPCLKAADHDGTHLNSAGQRWESEYEVMSDDEFDRRFAAGIPVTLTDANCHTLPDGTCVGPGPCLHTSEPSGPGVGSWNTPPEDS